MAFKDILLLKFSGSINDLVEARFVSLYNCRK